MIVALRIFRGVMGYLFAMQILTLLPVITWLQDIGAVTDGMWIQFVFKVITLVIAGELFFALRDFINKLHAKKYATPHPALVNKWGL